MVTSGIYGIKYRGIYYTFYNHSDSYFSHLGYKLLKEVKQMLDTNTLQIWIEKIINLKLVSENFKDDKNEDDEYYNHETLFKGLYESFNMVLNDGYIDIQRVCANITNYDDLGGQCVYILNIDDKYFYLRDFETDYNVSFNEIKKCKNVDELNLNS